MLQQALLHPNPTASQPQATAGILHVRVLSEHLASPGRGRRERMRSKRQPGAHRLGLARRQDRREALAQHAQRACARERGGRQQLEPVCEGVQCGAHLRRALTSAVLWGRREQNSDAGTMHNSKPIAQRGQMLWRHLHVTLEAPISTWSAAGLHLESCRRL